MSRELTEYRRTELLKRLADLTAEPAGEQLVAALFRGSRATFTIAETAALLSVSAKHLYSIIAAAGHVAPAVEVIRSGDRMVVPAHHLRRHLGIPEPHGMENKITAARLSPALLATVAETISWLVLVRLEAAELIELPDVPNAALRAGEIGAGRE
jgi:hypothetical protein